MNVLKQYEADFHLNIVYIPHYVYSLQLCYRDCKKLLAWKTCRLRRKKTKYFS